MNEEIEFKRRLKFSLFFPVLITTTMWLVKGIEWLFDTSFLSHGILPRSFQNSYGILASPFIHRNWEHLWANTLSFFILSLLLFFFYRKIAEKILLFIYFFSGVLLWSVGRYAYHIGMSGVIYGLATFLIFSGILKKNYRLTALSLVVIFLYGGLFWGLFPILEEMSWDGHLCGAATGLVLAIIFRNQGPANTEIIIDDETEIFPEEVWNVEDTKP